MCAASDVDRLLDSFIDTLDPESAAALLKFRAE
jgi:hypothetical protein